jgi:hypothetical protein
MHLGMDISAGIMVDERHTIVSSTVRNLSTAMAGVRSMELPVVIESGATNIVSYTFTLPNGDQLIALWTDGIAVDDDPGVNATLTFPGSSAQKVIGVDVLHAFEQELIIEMENGNLVIRDLLVKDYPIILRLTK